MKMVIAFLQLVMVEKVVQALHSVSGLSGATFTNVRGFGRGRVAGAAVSSAEELLGTAPRIRVEAMIPDALEESVVRAIRDAAQTGNRGDGKIFVASVDRAVRISTGEEGDGAV